MLTGNSKRDDPYRTANFVGGRQLVTATRNIRFSAIAVSIFVAVTSIPSAADPLGAAPTYTRRELSPVPNAQAIMRRIWVPGLDHGYVPQGITIIHGALYVSSYRADPQQGRGPCRVYKLDIGTGTMRSTLDLPPSCGHAGGLAKGPPGILFVADTDMLYEVALARNETILGEVTRAIPLHGGVRGSFAAASADALWLGTFAREPGAKLYKILFQQLTSSISPASTVAAVPLPTEAQGADFDASGALWVTRSTGAYGELLRLDHTTGEIRARYAMPVGIEGLSFDSDRRLWTLSEAGSKRWIAWSTFFPVIFQLDPTRLK